MQRLAAPPIRAGGGAAPGRRFRFTGSAGEYFRIWIVNLCLSLVTLGLYSPWAKVRTRQYFYANLVLDGSSFRYDADPKRILVGRLVVGALLLGNAVASNLVGPAGAALGLVLLVAIPWLAVRSLAFHQRHSLYRNVRFGFGASYAEAAAIFLLWPLLVTASLGLAYPAWEARRQRFRIGGSRYGATRFRFTGRAAPYFRVYARAAGALVAASALAAALAVLVAPRLDAWPGGAAALPGLALATAALGLAVAIVKAGTANLFFRFARLGELRFRSDLEPARLLWITLSGAAAVVLSLGLLVPWARVRLARYRASRLRVSAADLGAFVEAQGAGGGLGELASEAADALDLGFDFGL